MVKRRTAPVSCLINWPTTNCTDHTLMSSAIATTGQCSCYPPERNQSFSCRHCYTAPTVTLRIAKSPCTSRCLQRRRSTQTPLRGVHELRHCKLRTAELRKKILKQPKLNLTSKPAPRINQSRAPSVRQWLASVASGVMKGPYLDLILSHGRPTCRPDDPKRCE